MKQNCMTSLSGSENSFNAALPLEDNLVDNLHYLVGRMDSISSWAMLRVRRSFEIYKTELFSHCTEFNASGIERVICATGMNLEALHFIYCIDLMQRWQSEMIIADKSRVLARRLISGPSIIAELQHNYEREDTSIEQEYMLIKLLLEFNNYYIKNGRIFPAYIKVINREPYIGKKTSYYGNSQNVQALD